MKQKRTEKQQRVEEEEIYKTKLKCIINYEGQVNKRAEQSEAGYRQKIVYNPQRKQTS